MATILASFPFKGMLDAYANCDSFAVIIFLPLLSTVHHETQALLG
jgi:hypothetical protein